MKSKERLARDLTAADAPAEMIRAAMEGAYDDYESDSPTNIIDLVRACQKHGHHNPKLIEIARKAMDGGYDGTPEESEAWARRIQTEDPEFAKLLIGLKLGPKDK